MLIISKSPLRLRVAATRSKAGGFGVNSYSESFETPCVIYSFLRHVTCRRIHKLQKAACAASFFV